MTKTLLRAGALSCALLASTALTVPAMAQTARAHRNLDANGVDLTHGDFVAAIPEGSIGSGEAELPLVRQGVWVASGVNTNGHQWDRVDLVQQPAGGGGSNLTVTRGDLFENFLGGAGISPTTGSSLTGSGGAFDYRTADGTVVGFGDPSGSTGAVSNFCNGAAGQTYCRLLPMAITSPDGKTVTLNWEIWGQSLPGDADGDGDPDCIYEARIASVENSFGYEIRFTYASGGSGGTSIAPSSWHQRTGATFHNASVSGNPSQGSVSYSYPSTGVTQVTDMGGRVWRFTGSIQGLSGIRRPGAASDTTTINRSSGPNVSSVINEGVTTTYSRSVSGATGTMTVTNALSQVTTVVSNLTIGRPTSVTDPLSRTISYQYDADRRLTRVTAPEGNYVQYSYDSRGNVTEQRSVAKSGSGLADIVASATYDTTCSDPETCNRMSSSTDARGNVTNYTYDPTHGGVLTVTEPAPTGGAVRPQTRYSYTLTNGEYRLTGIAACQTQAGASGGSPAACAGAADEVVGTTAYDVNGNVTSRTAADGTGALSATQTMTYDALGNLLTVDGPLAGPDDLTRYRYNAARQLVGAIGPDPDGAGALKHRARRLSYTNGLPTRTETGTVNSQSDGDWAAFASLEEGQQDYDANARPVVQRLVSGSTTYALAQTSYDALGRTQCSAQRMNPAEFASLPSDACTLDTQGSFGPDRIVRATYDAGGQLSKIETGYGVSGVAADSVQSSYTANGQIETVTDANGNTTYFHYNAHDRRDYRVMPSPTTPGTWNWSDYEYYAYDANGNLTYRIMRDGQTIGFSYDALNRLTRKDLPGTVWYDIDRDYTYDNLGRRATAAGNGTITYVHDALGRLTSETTSFGTTSYLYDPANRRTRLTYTDGFYVTYDHLLTGEVTAIRENGAGSGAGVLGTYAYDDLGRRTSLTLGNGTVTSYSYDAVSRLSGLTQNLNGTVSDVTFGYSYNPASEIASNTRSNDAYSFALANANIVSTLNGLNQVTAIAGASVSHDARGNVSAVPAAGSVTGAARSFAYTTDNALAISSGATNNELISDSADRLHRYYDGSANRWFLYDGLALVAETNSVPNAIARRFVHGPGVDEPLAWYEGSGTATRRWFHADERGSVIAVSDASGDVLTAVNRYDDYGTPQGTLTGRFGYTGQVWLAEVGLYDYRARFYNPALGGRFMQTDPIGYDAGMNLYAYVGNNPVNRTDPLGLDDNDVIVNGCSVGTQPTSNGGCTQSNKDRIRVEDYLRLILSGMGDLFDTAFGQHVVVIGPRRVPTKVRVDKSCAGIPAAYSPAVHQQALEAMRQSLLGRPAEFGFWAYGLPQTRNVEVTSTFSEGNPKSISNAFSMEFQPMFSVLFIHTHPYYAPPSPTSSADYSSVRRFGTPVAALDRAGTLFCVR